MAERILVAAAEQPTASQRALLFRIATDRELPADTRMAIAERLAAGKGGRGVRRGLRQVDEMSQAALFAIVQDTNAAAKGRRKAAAKIAAHLLPMKPANKRWQFETDDCGFAINAEVAKEYREVDSKLWKLKRHSNPTFPTIAKMIRQLEAKRAEIVARLECPAPEYYGEAQISADRVQLSDYADKWGDGIALTAAEDADEAHRRARLHRYLEGPEQTARQYWIRLEKAEAKLKECRLFKHRIYAPPLTRKQRDDLRLLRALYPPHHHGTTGKAETGEERRQPKDFDEERLRWGHPFRDEEPAADGNFYPRDSKLRPPEPEILDEFVDVPPHCYFKPGVGLVFGYDPHVDSKTDTSFKPLDPPAE